MFSSCLWRSRFSASLGCLFIGTVIAFAQNADAPPSHLTTEGVSFPLGITEPHPRFSWQAPPGSRPQTAYEIQVFFKRSIWDSGRITSASRIQIPYNGPALQARQAYRWRVRTWSTGQPSAWSQPAAWEMGLLAPGDWKANWIAGRANLDHDWADADFRWKLTLVGEEVSLLFRAKPVGKTYGEAYLWRIAAPPRPSRNFGKSASGTIPGAPPPVWKSGFSRPCLSPFPLRMNSQSKCLPWARPSPRQ